MKVGELLKNLRKQKGLTQAQFAQLIEIEKTRISKYENEVDRISLEMFLKWCQKLNVDPCDAFKK